MKIILSYLCFLAFLSIGAQSSFALQIVRFKATDAATQKSVHIDSVLIKNVTMNLLKTFNTDSVDIELVTGINDNNQSDNPQFAIAGVPNPFENSTDFKVYITEPGIVTFTLFDIIANKIMSQSDFLDNGIHQYTLNGNGLIQGSYFMMINQNNLINILKLVKIGNSAGSSPFLISSSNYPKIIHNGKESDAKILIVNNNIFSFTCYAKNYWSLNSGDKSNSDLKANNVVNFLLTSNKKYNINGGTIDVGGFVRNNKNRTVTYNGPNKQSDNTSNESLNYNFVYQLQNISLPLTAGEYYELNAKFLDCFNTNDDSLSIDFCDRKFYYFDDNGPHFNSQSKVILLKFNPSLMVIDSLFINIFDRNFYPRPSQSSSYSNEELILENFSLFNLPFSIDSQNNVIVNLTGKTINDFLNYNYVRTVYSNLGSIYITETDQFVNIVSDNINSHIKIVLTP